MTLKRKPGALKNSLAFHQMAPDLKKIYELYYNNYTRKTKEFIELLELIYQYDLKTIKDAIDTLAKNKKSMVTTANIKLLVEKEKSPAIELWNEVFNDPALTVAMVDRLTHKSYVINMNGNSYRMK